MTINAKLFKKYDIRGRAMGENAPLTPHVAYVVGRAFAAYLHDMGVRRVVLGCDNRLSSKALAHEAVRGLMTACEVLDMSLTFTSCVNWAAVTNGNIGAMMITGSHLPPDQNGFKLGIGANSLYGEAITAIYHRIVASDFRDAPASVWHYAAEAYTDDLVSRILPAPQPLRVVIDAGNGMASQYAPHLINRLKHQVVDCLFCTFDGSYPNHHPDPHDTKNLRDLGVRVRETGADIGFAFDGDADRVGVVDERGEPIASDRLLALLARDLLNRHPGATVAADVTCSQVVFDTIAAHGGQPLLTHTGHSLVKAEMRAAGALLGGEVSGHLFFAEDYYGFDDAFLASGRLLTLFAQAKMQGMTVSDVNNTMKHYVSTPIYRIPCAPDVALEAIADIASDMNVSASVVSISTLDGLRVQFKKGWGGVRVSNTEPVLSLRFEGETREDVFLYRRLMMQSLWSLPGIDIKPHIDLPIEG